MRPPKPKDPRLTAADDRYFCARLVAGMLSGAERKAALKEAEAEKQAAYDEVAKITMGI